MSLPSQRVVVHLEDHALVEYYTSGTALMGGHAPVYNENQCTNTMGQKMYGVLSKLVGT